MLRAKFSDTLHKDSNGDLLSSASSRSSKYICVFHGTAVAFSACRA